MPGEEQAPRDVARARRRPFIRAGLLGMGILSLGSLGYFLSTGNAPPLPQEGESTRAETAAWLERVRTHGQDGDWIAIRGYHAADHLVAGATLKPLSHAAILDLSNNEVIEAVSPKVRVVSLESFIEHTHRFELIRPQDGSSRSGEEAVRRAREKVGTPYDFLGTIGLPSEKRAYCSELCAWAWGIEVDRKGPKKVLHPADMSRYGEVVLEEGPRKLAQAKLP
jgi:hypothetical protein